MCQCHTPTRTDTKTHLIQGVSVVHRIQSRQKSIMLLLNKLHDKDFGNFNCNSNICLFLLLPLRVYKIKHIENKTIYQNLDKLNGKNKNSYNDS
jgi:hypothetical protein